MIIERMLLLVHHGIDVNLERRDKLLAVTVKRVLKLDEFFPQSLCVNFNNFDHTFLRWRLFLE